MHCLAGVCGYSKMLAVVILKVKLRKIRNCLRREKVALVSDSSYLIFGNSCSKVSILGLSTEPGDRIFQSIIVRVNKN